MHDKLLMYQPGGVSRAQISKSARCEADDELESLRKQAAQFRREIARLKRQIVALLNEHAVGPRAAGQRPTTNLVDLSRGRVHPGSAEQIEAQHCRFRADGLRSHRAKLGLSAVDYGRLIGVSALTIYSYESGKSRPRAAQLQRLVIVRGIGKREALRRLQAG